MQTQRAIYEEARAFAESIRLEANSSNGWKQTRLLKQYSQAKAQQEKCMKKCDDEIATFGKRVVDLRKCQLAVMKNVYKNKIAYEHLYLVHDTPPQLPEITMQAFDFLKQ